MIESDSRTAASQATAFSRGWSFFAIVPVAFVAIWYLFPVVVALAQSVASPHPGLQNFQALLTTPAYIRVALRTVWIAVIVTAICVVVGYPVAYAVGTAGPWGRRLLLIGVISPYLTSILVRTFAWEVLLGRLGLAGRLLRFFHLPHADLLFTPAAVIIGLVHLSLPLMILPLVSVMQQVDRSVIRSAASLGAGPTETMLTTFMPLTLSGIEAGCVLVFVYSIGAFITPAILGASAGQMLGVSIDIAVEQFADFGFAAAAAVLLTAAVMFVLAIYAWRFSGNAQWFAGAHVAPVSPSGRRTAWGRIAARAVRRAAQAVDRLALVRSRAPLLLIVGAAFAFLLLPQLIAIPISFSPTRTLIFPQAGFSTQWYAGYFTPEWLKPTTVSLVVATSVAIAATILAMLAALAVTRGLSPAAGRAVTILMFLPLLIPAIVSAVAFYVFFAPLHLTDSIVGLIVAHTAIVVPLAFAVLSANLRALGHSYEQAAASLGARRFTVLRRIVVPLVARGLAVSLFLTFLTSFDETVVAIFLSGVHVKTLPRRMFEALTMESDPTIGVVATLLMAMAALVLIGSHLVTAKTSADVTAGIPVAPGLPPSPASGGAE
jgi:putative spermidine/putrescine transport system permease protein